MTPRQHLPSCKTALGPMFRAPTPVDQTSGDPAARASPLPGLPFPKLPGLPHLPGASPGPPSPRIPSPAPLPEAPALPLPLPPLPLPVVENPTCKKGLRRRLKLDKLLGGGPPKVPVVGAPVSVKLPKRARLKLFLTRMKLKRKGVNTPSASAVLKGKTQVEDPVANPLPGALPK